MAAAPRRARGLPPARACACRRFPPRRLLPRPPRRGCPRQSAPSLPPSRSMRTTISSCSTSRRALPCRAAPRPRIISMGCSKGWGRTRNRGSGSCIGSTAIPPACSWSRSVAKSRRSSAAPSRPDRCARSIGRWCKGVPKPPQGKVDAALVKASGPEGDRVRKARPGEQEVAQSAVTYYAVVDQGRAEGLLALAQARHRAPASAPRPYGHHRPPHPRG